MNAWRQSPVSTRAESSESFTQTLRNADSYSRLCTIHSKRISQNEYIIEFTSRREARIHRTDVRLLTHTNCVGAHAADTLTGLMSHDACRLDIDLISSRVCMDDLMMNADHVSISWERMCTSWPFLMVVVLSGQLKYYPLTYSKVVTILIVDISLWTGDWVISSITLVCRVRSLSDTSEVEDLMLALQRHR